MPEKKEPDWDIYKLVNEENRRLFSVLRDMHRGNVVFFYDDPQPIGQDIGPNDIAVLHIDTCGTSLPLGAAVWTKLTEGWSKAKVFLHQPGLGGASPLPNGMALAPGINILCEKNIPRKMEEAKCNIKRAGIKDDMDREPWLDDKLTKWMFIARADPSKGQIPVVD